MPKLSTPLVVVIVIIIVMVIGYVGILPPTPRYVSQEETHGITYTTTIDASGRKCIAAEVDGNISLSCDWQRTY